MASRISSKDLLDKRVLGGCGEEVLLLVFAILGLVSGDVGEDVKTGNWGRGNGSTGDDIGRAVGDVEEGIIFRVVKGRPGELRGWGILKFRGLRGDGLEDTGGNVKRTWVIPSIVRALKDLEDGGGGVCNVLLIDVVTG